jgi:hypothetical protein
MKTLVLIICIFTSTYAFTRPTNEWLIIFNNNQTQIVEAESVDEALLKFRKEHKNVRIFSVAQRSYVESIWISQTPFRH